MVRKLVVNLLFFLVAAGTGLYLSRDVWTVYREQAGRRDEAVREMEESERRKVDLLRQKAKIESPAGREQLARDRGHLKPGEEPLRGDR